jgi:asparagine synthase (glutamine-hydrolysing)
MCGIGGIWRPGGGEADHADLRRMMSAMRHRGPEGAGFARLDDGRLQLGFLKLGFTDAPGGLQPLYNADHSLAILFNGEVYDHHALRERLESQGHRFRGRSDTEVVVHLYEQHGDAFTDHLNGEYAIVLWDAGAEELVLLRDPYGVKPLFTAWHRGAFVFASECKAILALDGFSAGIDPDWFTGPGIGLPGPWLTPFVGITQVNPGHVLRVGRRGSSQAAWWKPRFEKRAWQAGEAEAAVRGALRASVVRRVGGDVPIALSVSSGLDSAIVAGVAADVRPGLTAFGVSYPGRDFDEGAGARRTAAHHGLRFEPVVCDVDGLADGFLASVWSTETATNGLSTVARLALTRAVRAAGFKALAGGEASDEIFGGYPYFGLEAIWRAGDREALRRFRADERDSRGVFWDERARGPHALGFASVYPPRVRRAGRLLGRVLSRSARARMSRTPTDTMHQAFDVSGLRALDPFDATRMVSRGVFASLVPAALGDRVEMANSLEGRVPFLDRQVVDFGLSLPQDACVEPATFARKAVLRRAFAASLPPGFAPPPKHTWMAPPIAELAKTAVGRGLFAGLLGDAAVRAAGVLDPLAVRFALAAWRAWPRGGRRFPAVDGAIGWMLAVQALDRVFVSRAAEHGHRGPALELTDCSPVEPPRRKD